MRKTSKILASLAVASSLLLSACGGSDEENPEDNSILTPGDASNPTATPTAEPLPDPPTNSLEEDLSTPEGVVTAYTAYLYVGDGAKACPLLTGPAAASQGVDCENNISTYAESLFRDYDDSLDVANVITTDTLSKSASAAKVSSVIQVSPEYKYFETYDLVLTGGKWKISSFSRLTAQPE